MGKRVFITGFDGFLGRNLSDFLTSTGYEVYGLVRKGKQRVIKATGYLVEGNILDQHSLDSLLQEITPDIIFHFAALSRVGHSFSDPSAYLLTNGVGTSNLLESVRKYSRKSRIIYASSAEVYGPVSLNESLNITSDETNSIHLKEDQWITPTTSPYSISKICGEYLMKCYHDSYGLDTVTVRSFNIEGPGRGDGFATSIISKQAAALISGYGQGFTMGNLAVFRDFTHISDAVRAYSLIATNGVKGSTYNLGSMRCTSLASYLVYATEAAGFPVDAVNFYGGTRVEEPLKEVPMSEKHGGLITHLDQVLLENWDLIIPGSDRICLSSGKRKIPIHIDASRFRPSDNPLIVADSSRLAELGYTPNHPVRSIATDQVEFYLARNQ